MFRQWRIVATVLDIHLQTKADLMQEVLARGTPCFSLALDSAGTSSAAKMAIIAMTTSNSIEVKALSSVTVRFGAFILI